MKKDYSKEAVSRAASKFLSTPEAKADQEAQAPEEPKKTIRTRTKKSAPKPEEAAEVKRSGKPFSIYIRDDVKQRITAYTAITGMKTSQLITEAVLSYITEHKITEEQKTAYQNRHKMITDIMNELS